MATPWLAFFLLALSAFSAKAQTQCEHHGECGVDEFCRVQDGGGVCTPDCGTCYDLDPSEVAGRFCPACPNVRCESHDECHCVDYCTDENWCLFSCHDCERDGRGIGGTCPPCPNENGTCGDFVGSCEGSCGGATNTMNGTCYCNEFCSTFGDCCDDFRGECRLCQGHHECLSDQFCSKDFFCHHGIDSCAAGVTGNSIDDECPPDPNVHGILTGSCEGSCGGQASDGDCFCNAQCELIGDCCVDFDDQCGHICQGHHECEEGEYCADTNVCVEACDECEANGDGIDGECPPCPNTHGLLSGSCAGGCGGKSADGDCFCNVFCLVYGDCCRDYENFCHACQSDEECLTGACEDNRFCRTAAQQEALVNGEESSGLSTGAVVGIAVAAVFVGTLLIGVAFSQCKKSRGRGEIATDNSAVATELDRVDDAHVASGAPAASSAKPREEASTDAELR